MVSIFSSRPLMLICLLSQKLPSFSWWKKKKEKKKLPYAAHCCIRLLCNGHMIMPPILLGEANIFTPPSIPQHNTLQRHLSAHGHTFETYSQQSPYLGFMTIPVRVFPFDWTNASARVMRPHPSQPIRSVNGASAPGDVEGKLESWQVWLTRVFVPR